MGYLEERASQFVPVTDDQDLTIEPVDNDQPITDSEVEKVRKQNKDVAKRKMQLNNLCAHVWAPAAGFAALSLSRPASVSCSESSAFLSSCPGSPTRLLLLLAYLRTPTAFSSRLVPAPVLGSPAVLLPFPVVGPSSLYLASTAFRTFKRALSNEPWRCLTSPAEPFCLVLPLGLFRNKTDCKQTFDTAFINSRRLAGNHA